MTENLSAVSISSVLAAVERQCRDRPTAPAVRDVSAVTSYGDLWAGAEEVAAKLRAAGVGAEDVVAVRTRPRSSAVSLLLGIWLCGASYLPVDVSYPAARVRAMLEAAAVRFFVTDEGLDSGEWSAPTLTMEGLDGVEAAQGGRPALAEDATAYVIFTSGSTGSPKGVAVGHRALDNLLASFEGRLDVGEEDVVLWSTTLSFDVAGLEIWLPLVAGGCLAVAADDAVSDYANFDRSLRKLGVTIMQGTPSAWRLLKEEGWQAGLVRCAICGGESLPVDLAHWLVDCVPRAVNAYGPTETTIWSSTKDLAEWAGGAPSIGRPIANTTFHILDAEMNPVDEGEIGQICIGGSGLALGYLGALALTAGRFLPDPFDGHGARLYATGDLGYLRDGDFFHAGREDRQVKIRGHRIELDEVRNSLLRQADLNDAAVTVSRAPDGTAGLDAYLVPRPDVLGRAVEESSRDRARAWRDTFEANFSPDRVAIEGQDQAALRLNGWISSVTGDSFPEGEISSWGDSVVGAVRPLAPSHALEIGAGGGLITEKLAPHCERYLATDIAAAAVDRLRAAVRARGLSHVQVEQMAAHEVERLELQSIDCVVMTSVVQYFPSEEYLRRILRQLVDRLPDGASIFIADIRHLQLLRTFNLWREDQRAAPGTAAGSVLSNARRRMRGEGELLLSPDWFLRFAAEAPRVETALVGPSIDPNANEMTLFRFQVSMTIGPDRPFPEEEKSLAWGDDLGDLTGLERALDQVDDVLRVEGIPQRTLGEAIALADAVTAAGLATPLESIWADDRSARGSGLDPFEVAATAHNKGLEVALRYPPRAVGAFDAVFRRANGGGAKPGGLFGGIAVTVDPHKKDRLVRDPSMIQGLSLLRREFAPKVRAQLATELPKFMLPQRFTFLEDIPLLQNGKVDHNALVEIGASFQGHRTFIAPATQTENDLAELWSEILDSEHDCGREDDFFDLGGHSLSAAQLAARIREAFDVDFDLRMVFDNSELRGLAAAVDAQRHEAPVGGRSPIGLAERLPLGEWLENFGRDDGQGGGS